MSLIGSSIPRSYFIVSKYKLDRLGELEQCVEEIVSLCTSQNSTIAFTIIDHVAVSESIDLEARALFYYTACGT